MIYKTLSMKNGLAFYLLINIDGLDVRRMVAMKKITIYRHAESEANIGGVSKPNAEILITDEGQKNAKILAQSIVEKPTKIYISEFIRTKQSAAPVCTKFNIEPQPLAQLNEFNTISFELVEGLTGAQRVPLTRKYWVEADPNARFGKDAETFNEFAKRVIDFIRVLKTLEDGSIIFCHGMWMSYFLWSQLAREKENNRDVMRNFFRFHQSIKICNLEPLTVLVQGDELFIKLR